MDKQNPSNNDDSFYDSNRSTPIHLSGRLLLGIILGLEIPIIMMAISFAIFGTDPRDNLYLVTGIILLIIFSLGGFIVLRMASQNRFTLFSMFVSLITTIVIVIIFTIPSNAQILYDHELMSSDLERISKNMSINTNTTDNILNDLSEQKEILLKLQQSQSIIEEYILQSNGSTTP